MSAFTPPKRLPPTNKKELFNELVKLVRHGADLMTSM